MPSNVIDRKLPVKYSPELALRICELIAEGETVSKIAERDDMPSRTAIYNWLTVYPKFFDAFERAMTISAMSLEERALTMADELRSANDFTGTKVQAYNYAMQQLRWSAARRDKNRYGQQSAESKSIPITIVTSLNLGQDGRPATDNEQSIYTLTATIGAPDTNVIGAEGDVLDLEPEEADTPGTDDQRVPRAYGLPDTEQQQLHNPPTGRPPKTRRRKGHKSAAGTARTAAIYSKSPDTPKDE